MADWTARLKVGRSEGKTILRSTNRHTSGRIRRGYWCDRFWGGCWVSGETRYLFRRLHWWHQAAVLVGSSESTLLFSSDLAVAEQPRELTRRFLALFHNLS